MLKMTLYEANKQLMENEKPLDPIEFNRLTYSASLNLIEKKYLMLLCHERRDYTLFNLDHATVRDLNKDLIECLKVRGLVTSIDNLKDGNYEIWIRDKSTKEDFCYYLFDYENGVIEYNE